MRGHDSIVNNMVARVIIFLAITTALAGCDGPAKLQVVGDIPGLDAWDVDTDGEFLYIAEGTQGLVVADISDPRQPSVVTTLLPTDASGGGNLELSGDHAYMQAFDDSVFVIDISDPLRPVEAGKITDLIYDYVIAEDVLYGINGLFYIFDLSVPSSPRKVSGLDLEVSLKSVAAWGDLVFLGAFLDGLYIIDVSDPVAPVQIGHHEEYTIYALTAADGLLYMMTLDDLLILDIADPTQPRLRGRHASSCQQSVYEISVIGERAYVSGDGCVEVYDVSDAESPDLVATLDVLIRAPYWGITAHGEYIYVAQLGRLLVLPAEE